VAQFWHGISETCIYFEGKHNRGIKMAAIRERKKRDGTSKFHVQVRMAGFPARTASFTTRRSAQRWAKTIEAAMIEGKHFRSVEARSRSLADAIDRYLEMPMLSGQAEGSPKKGQLLWWKAEIGGRKLAEITPALIVEARDRLLSGTYQRARPGTKNSKLKASDKPGEHRRKPATVNRYLAALSHVFTIARREWHWLSYNPVEDVSRFPEDERVRCLSEDERKALLRETAKDPVLHTFVLIALSTACRAGELQKLQWRDVNLKEGRILWRKPKNKKARSTWLYGEALAALKAHGKVRDINGTVFPNVGGTRKERGKGKEYDYGHLFRAAIDAAGIHDFHFHDLRHTAATYLARAGVSEQQLKAIGGWKSGVVSRYVHLAAEDQKAALQKLAQKIDAK
jgi:integrase